MSERIESISERYDTPESVKEWNVIEWIDKKLRENWIEENYEQAQELAEEGFRQKMEEGCNRGRAWYLDWLGRIAEAQHKFEDGETYFLEGLDFVSKDEYKEGKVHFYKRLHSNLSDQGRDKESIEYYRRYLKVIKEISHYANQLEMEGNFYEAIEVYMKIATIEEHNPDYKSAYELVEIYSNIASLYRKLSEFDISKKFLIRTLHIYQDICLDIEEADTMRKIGVIAREQANYKEADTWFDRSLSICLESPRKGSDDYIILIDKIQRDIAETKEIFAQSLNKKEGK